GCCAPCSGAQPRARRSRPGRNRAGPTAAPEAPVFVASGPWTPPSPRHATTGRLPAKFRARRGRPRAARRAARGSDRRAAFPPGGRRPSLGRRCGCGPGARSRDVPMILRRLLATLKDLPRLARFAALAELAYDRAAHGQYEAALELLRKAYAARGETAPSPRVGVETNMLVVHIAGRLQDVPLTLTAARLAIRQLEDGGGRYSPPERLYLTYWCQT